VSSAAKRAIAQAAQAAAPAGASAARAPSQPISVHLTPFAPGCAGAPIHDARRWRTFYGKTPDEVLRATLKRIRRAPGAVRAKAENGDVLLLADVAPEVLRQLTDAPTEAVPFAVFWDGLTLDQVRAGLGDLAARGWVPLEDHP